MQKNTAQTALTKISKTLKKTKSLDSYINYQLGRPVDISLFHNGDLEKYRIARSE